jgi:hypothetical protein
VRFCTAGCKESIFCCCRWLSQSFRIRTRSCSRNAPRAGWSRAAHRAPPVLSGVATLTQNKYLRIISGVYKAILICYLKSKMAILSLNFYFDKWVADFENRVAISGISQLLREAGARAAEMAAGSRKRRRPK